MIDVIFDTETTGLWDNTVKSVKKQPKIIELYAVKIDRLSGTVLDEIDTFFHVGEPLSEKTKLITKITDEMLIDAPKFSEFAPRLKKLFETADRVVAHNLVYDREMVNFEMQRCNLTLTWPSQLCLIEQTEWFEGFWLNLTKLHKLLFGEAFPEAHRARNDAEATLRCYRKLVEDGMI